MKARFGVVKRKNVHAKNGFEWALNVDVDSSGKWTIRVFDREPSKEKIADEIQFATRCFEIYHIAINKPKSFRMDVDYVN